MGFADTPTRGKEEAGRAKKPWAESGQEEGRKQRGDEGRRECLEPRPGGASPRPQEAPSQRTPRPNPPFPDRLTAAHRVPCGSGRREHAYAQRANTCRNAEDHTHTHK